MSYRDEERAREERLQSLEARAAEADALRRRVWELEEENRRLREQLGAPPATASPTPLELERPSPPTYDFDDPRLAAAEAAQDWALLAELYEEHAASDDAERAVAALLHQSVIYRDHLADDDRADEANARALELDPTHLGALSFRIAGARQRERWYELTQLLERAIDLAPDALTYASSAMALGDVHRLHLADEERAAAAYRRALDVDPSLATACSFLRKYV
jgi:tetratricopeptide (TPR) repeat protein